MRQPHESRASLLMFLWMTYATLEPAAVPTHALAMTMPPKNPAHSRRQARGARGNRGARGARRRLRRCAYARAGVCEWRAGRWPA